jgi:hypothetical protein
MAPWWKGIVNRLWYKSVFFRSCQRSILENFNNMQVVRTKKVEKKRGKKKLGRNTVKIKRLQRTENCTDGHYLISNFHWV